MNINGSTSPIIGLSSFLEGISEEQYRQIRNVVVQSESLKTFKLNSQKLPTVYSEELDSSSLSGPSFSEPENLDADDVRVQNLPVPMYWKIPAMLERIARNSDYSELTSIVQDQYDEDLYWITFKGYAETEYDLNDMVDKTLLPKLVRALDERDPMPESTIPSMQIIDEEIINDFLLSTKRKKFTKLRSLSEMEPHERGPWSIIEMDDNRGLQLFYKSRKLIQAIYGLDIVSPQSRKRSRERNENIRKRHLRNYYYSRFPKSVAYHKSHTNKQLDRVPLRACSPVEPETDSENEQESGSAVYVQHLSTEEDASPWDY